MDEVLTQWSHNKLEFRAGIGWRVSLWFELDSLERFVGTTMLARQKNDIGREREKKT